MGKLVAIQYKRNDHDVVSGTFQVRGDYVDVVLPYQKDKLRIELFGDTIDELQWVHRQNNNVVMNLDNTLIFPAKHFVTPPDRQQVAIASIKDELQRTLPTIEKEHIRDRLSQRIGRDVEMLQETGYCSGIENYSSHFDGRQRGVAPHCLLDFFPKEFLFLVDESHIAIPQLRGMYAGDQARKRSLIEFGFRLPSARDNRPLQFSGGLS